MVPTGDEARLAAEQRARVLIDTQLEATGWILQDKRELNLFAGQGVAVHEVVLKPGHGRADYLQLLTPRDRRVPREQQVAEMSRGLKIIAREQNIPVVALAQVSRASTLRRDGQPTLADLRESGGIEADADTVVLLHRDEDDINAGELEMLIAKNRHGPTGQLTALFQGHYARIVSCHPQASRT